MASKPSGQDTNGTSNGRKNSSFGPYTQSFTYPAFHMDYVKPPLNPGKTPHDAEVTSGEERDPWAGISYVTTVHGLDKITQRSPFQARRWVWLVLILCSLCVFGYQATLRLLYYLDHPVNMNFKVVYNQSLVFPAVVICNQNTFRLSAAAQQGWYHLLDDLYSRDDLSTFEPDKYRAGNLSMLDLHLLTAHQREDLITECEWNRKKCDISNFTTTLTDHGVCYTFNHPDTGQLLLSHTGSGDGLTLKLNVEQYEYMAGPHYAAGLKILLHGHNDVPFVKDLGEAVPTGMDAFVTINTVKTTNLPEPHGDCSNEVGYSKSRCQSECRTEYALRRCGCRDIYMQPKQDRPEEFNNQDMCTCPDTCELTHYESIITYASTPNENVFTSTSNDTILADKYLTARETAQRVFQPIVDRDRALVKSVLDTYNFIEDAIQKVLQATENLRNAKGGLLDKLEPRIQFHQTWGLEKIEFTVQNDFVRLWDVLDERTLAHVTTGFYQTTALYRDMVNLVMSNQSDATQRQIWHESTHRDLLFRQHLIDRALTNLSVIHEAFCNGTPEFVYEASPNRHYDLTWIPYEILNREKYRVKYYDSWNRYLGIAEEQLKILMEINDQIYANLTYDHAKMEEALLKYEHRCRSHNYYRYMYHSRVVLPTLARTQDAVQNFEKLREDLADKVEDVDNSFRNINVLVEVFNQTSGANIARGVEKASRYLNDNGSKKYDVATFSNTKEIMNDLTAFNTLFKDLRARALQIIDSWYVLSGTVGKILQTMLDETWTMPFYQAVLRDLDLHKANHSEELLAIWAEMLEMPLTNMTVDEIKMRMNADFPQLDTTAVLDENHRRFRESLNSNDIVEIIGDNADYFLQAFEIMQSSLAGYLKTTTIDANFYSDNFLRLNIFAKQLTYEHMANQPAYDVVALLSDIGGTLSLCIGASAITLFEVFDAILIHFIKSYSQPNKT